MSSPTPRRAHCTALLPLAAALALAGCVTRLSEIGPAGVNLTGTWRLDPEHSSDTAKILQDLARPKRGSSYSGTGGDADNTPFGGSGGGRRQRPGQGQGQGQGQSGGSDSSGTGYGPDTGAGGPNQPYRPPVDIQESELRGGAWLQIEQRPDEMIINNGETRRSFTPGTNSVVSVASGVADQSSGWNGRDYYVRIKPQVGPSITERYRLSPDGKQLTETISFGSEGRVPATTLTRVYLPTDHLPSALPGD